MKILSVDQIRKADQYTIENEPIASIDLMERAATAFTEWLIRKFDNSHPVKVFCGIGNNGGDGLVAARLLAQKNYRVDVFIVLFSPHKSEDFRTNEQRLTKIEEIESVYLQNAEALPDLNASDIVIDALWGSGLSRPIEGFSTDIIQHINRSDATVVAMDIPSGMYADKHTDSVAVNADYTVSFEFPKFSFLLPGSYQYTGEWVIVPIGLHPDYAKSAETSNYYITEDRIKPLLKKRNKFDHKGVYGHALLIAGGRGKIGASVLCAKACMKAGVGLLTMHIPKCGYTIMQTAVPEAMVITDIHEDIFTEANVKAEKKTYNAIAFGPGIGQQVKSIKGFEKLLKEWTIPMVIDADGLNMFSSHHDLLDLLPEGSILTPHPGEFKRLAGTWENDFERYEKQMKFARKYKIYLVLKGAYTSIATPDGTCYFNSTGNPGMATAGIGDSLTGILCSLLAQGYTPFETSIMGVYLHGFAGDIAANEDSEESLIASDLIGHLGKAFNSIKKKNTQ